jgi:uncharacterized protein (DUF2062 family)
LGAWVTGETAFPSESAETRGVPEKDRTVLQRIEALGKPLLVGLSIMACLAGVTTYVLIDLLWRWRTKARWRRRGN